MRVKLTTIDHEVEGIEHADFDWHGSTSEGRFSLRDSAHKILRRECISAYQFAYATTILAKSQEVT